MSNHNPPVNGFDKHPERINRKGRPKTFDALRNLAQSIANEVAMTKGQTDRDGKVIIPPGPVVIEGHIATVAEMILRSWANSKDPRLVTAFIEYAYGKVPVKQENYNIDLDQLTPEELERLADGEDPSHVLKRLAVKGGGEA